MHFENISHDAHWWFIHLLKSFVYFKIFWTFHIIQYFSHTVCLVRLIKQLRNRIKFLLSCKILYTYNKVVYIAVLQTEYLHPSKIHMLKFYPPNVMVSWDPIFGRWSGHEGGALETTGLVPFKQEPRKLLSSFFCQMRTQQRWLSMKQEVSPHQTLNLPVPWSWTSQPPELWGKKCLLFKPPILW